MSQDTSSVSVPVTETPVAAPAPQAPAVKTPIPAGHFRAPFSYPGIFEEGKDYPFEEATLKTFWDAVKEYRAAGVPMNKRALDAIFYASKSFRRNQTAHGSPSGALPVASLPGTVSPLGATRALPPIARGRPIHVLGYCHDDHGQMARKVLDRWYRSMADAVRDIEAATRAILNAAVTTGSLRLTCQDHSLQTKTVAEHRYAPRSLGLPPPVQPAPVVRQQKDAGDRKQEAVNAALGAMAQALAALQTALTK